MAKKANLQAVKQALDFEAVGAALVIDTPKKFAWAETQLCDVIHPQLQALESQRLELTRPILDSKKNVDRKFKPAVDALKKAKEHFKEALLSFWEQSENETEAMLEKARHLQETGGNKGQITKLVRKAQANSIQEHRCTRRDKWTFEVEDSDQIPEEYWTVDLKMLQARADALGEEADIPGVRFYTISSLVVGQ